ncbi:methionine--tRNA ligase [Thermaurantimonas aggregans]|uniref:Methionine--tRNA ligase n=1 Tax=Thermaurantimonas aggregans TaxID=2173829 RepID=A0A401XKW8_9FLAO|nr:methionine--tRNA ligase [Thermaurantimonas aggregans]
MPADIYVRYLKLAGEDVKFICGSDEHGVPITIKARKEGITPQEVVDKYHALMKKAFADFGISFDIYSRTSSPLHHTTASQFFKTLYDKGVFIEEETEQYYDEQAGQFLADRYIIGTCPKCGFANAYGDQCESCGSSLNPTDLIQPRSALSGAEPVLRKTKNWYLPLDKFQSAIEAYTESLKDVLKPNVYGQVKSWLQQGLAPRAMTRDLEWGVPVPLEGAKGKVLYVWFDAPIGYISATKELLPETWQSYWQSDETALIHFIGKDNIVFHCIIFPAMLMAHGGYVLPANVPANEFLNLEGDKISTSRNWAIWLHEYLAEMPDRESELRYVLTSIAPETSDSEFTWRDYQARINNELVAIPGNLANRILTLIQKYYDGKLPCDVIGCSDAPMLEKAIEEAYTAIDEAIRHYKFRNALQAWMDLARAGNKYLTDAEPWKLYKSQPEETLKILNNGLFLLGHLAKLMMPFMPKSAEKLLYMLGKKKITNIKDNIYWQAGEQLPKPELLFRKMEDAELEPQIQKLAAIRQQSAQQTPFKNSTAAPMKDTITFDDFQKLDLRIATVIAAERVPKADKLLQLTLDTGIDRRTVVSGVAQHYNPEDLIGKQILLLANLAPRKIRGVESHGMILFAENSDGSLVTMVPSKPVKNGSSVA